MITEHCGRTGVASFRVGWCLLGTIEGLMVS